MPGLSAWGANRRIGDIVTVPYVPPVVPPPFVWTSPFSAIEYAQKYPNADIVKEGRIGAWEPTSASGFQLSNNHPPTPLKIDAQDTTIASRSGPRIVKGPPDDQQIPLPDNSFDWTGWAPYIIGGTVTVIVLLKVT